MSELKEVFLHGKPARILVGIKRGQDSKYASVLSREANCTYSHTVKILNTFKEHGLIEFEKEGRKKLIELTDEGADVAEGMEGLIESIEMSNN
jgi:predicted transcriptional regulator